MISNDYFDFYWENPLKTYRTVKHIFRPLKPKFSFECYKAREAKILSINSFDVIWKDKLAYYNGSAIEYDAQGNPTNYLGHSLVWEKGRQLKSFDNISFTYNANGIRTSKTVDGIKHTYTLDGTKILREEWENNVLETIFDNEDAVCGIVYNNVPYYFVKNLQGDIIAITNSTGTVVARYSYDAWGKCTIEQDYSLNGSIATVNPYRYRGYYYDKETELYYLQSRYYDTEIGRFVNGDDAIISCLPLGILNHNMFSYCINTPINTSDPTGHSPEVIAAGILIGGCFALCSLISWMSTSEFKKSWEQFCKTVGNGLSKFFSTIKSGANAAKYWDLKLIILLTAAVATYTVYAKADSKVRTKIKNNNNFTYFTAQSNWVNGYRTVTVGTGITQAKAVSRLKTGKNVFTMYGYNARKVCALAGKATPMWHSKEKSIPNYYNHYHINKHSNSAHCWYLI